jgi:hypothetical protein
MSSVNYAAMSYQELRRYFSTVSDPDFDSKIQASIHQQIAEYQNGNAG